MAMGGKGLGMWDSGCVAGRRATGVRGARGHERGRVGAGWEYRSRTLAAI